MTQNIDPNLAVDLTKPGASIDSDALARQAAKENENQERARRHFAAWDRKMQRAFQGIISRPLRHRFLAEYIERLEQHSEGDDD